MIVYKVVREEDGKLKSAIRRVEISKGIVRVVRVAADLTYQQGKTTKPKFGKIFAFESIKTARTFFGYQPVWEAEAPDAEPIAEVAADGEPCLRRFKDYWAGKEIDRMLNAPRGTVVCSELTLIREIICV